MVDRSHEHPPRELTLTPQLLVAAYCQGVFPMARSRHAPGVEWFSPDPRAVLPLDRFKCPRTLRQAVERRLFDIRHDTAFADVITACSHKRPGHPETWINRQIIESFIELHELGVAHSVEAWRDGQLVGGLYGVAIGGAFCGESMFHRPDLGGTNASKVCLAHLVAHMKSRGFILLDVQMNSDHMRRFGTVEIPRKEYLRRLTDAIAMDVSF
ncbi:MAG: leucyl/phenylalanyl-tRNA--protein transferase [Planctomycetes bacterium]|nr:leucyl/phenylalanyl-tRNA--protein transferase [Planctomycetota bacterium]